MVTDQCVADLNVRLCSGQRTGVSSRLRDASYSDASPYFLCSAETLSQTVAVDLLEFTDSKQLTSVFSTVLSSSSSTSLISGFQGRKL